jgi:hypothetical protein
MIARRSGRAIIFDDVVKSPIYCVGSVFQALSMLHVLPRPRKTTTPSI